MAGTYPNYEQVNELSEPVAQFYEKLQGFTMELLPGEVCNWIYSYVLLPPLEHDGITTRGVLLTMAAGYLCERHPSLRELFHVVASSQWCSYAWAGADSLCSIYDNPQRDAWFRSRYPDRTRQLLPIQEADWTNEQFFRPSGQPPRRELICVSRPLTVKNLPFIAQALKVYRLKYRPIRLTLVAGYNTNWSNLAGQALLVMRQVAAVLGNIADYLDLEEFRDPAEMPALYTDHRVLLMGSLLEGKNRALHEAMACDLPVVCFEDFNRHLRGPVDIFPAGAGAYAEFDPEAYADAIETALRQRDAFTPRAAYQRGFSGRQSVVARCLRALPEYSAAIPDIASAAPVQNEWLNAALEKRYSCNVQRFLYEENPCNTVIGLDHHDLLVEFYRQKTTARAGRVANGVSA